MSLISHCEWEQNLQLKAASYNASVKTGGEVKERARRDVRVLTVFTDGIARKKQILRRGCRLYLRCHRMFANMHI